MGFTFGRSGSEYPCFKEGLVGVSVHSEGDILDHQANGVDRESADTNHYHIITYNSA